jgi:hypothetical protein
MLYEVSVAGKLVELLKESAPQLERVALLFNPENTSATGYWKSIDAVAHSLGVRPVSLPVPSQTSLPHVSRRSSIVCESYCHGSGKKLQS